MAVRIGTEISGIQKNLLDDAKRSKDLNEIAESMLEVINDDDITSGRENVHPDWHRLFHNYKSHIKKIISKDEFAQLQKSFKTDKPYDSNICEINPDKCTTVFLLGAGASKPVPSDIPTVKELLPDLLSRARRLNRTDLKGLADFCEQTKIDNIEDLLTAAQLSEYCSQNPQVLQVVEYLLYRKRPIEKSRVRFNRITRESVDLSAVAFLKDTLQVLFGLLSSRMLPARPNKGHKAIAKYVKKRKGSSIVTTNYDCCMDLALGKEGHDFTYLVDFSNFSSNNSNSEIPPLIKLHGSLNWFYCETCQQVHLIDINKTIREYSRDTMPYSVIAVCRDCGGQRRGLLMPPQALKFDVAPPLTPLIQNAQQSLNKADLIVVVGFSFAEADLYISRMLIKSMQNSKDVKMIIFDTDISIVEKILTQVSSRITDFDDKRIMHYNGDCSKTLPRFLNGDLYKMKKKK